MSFGSFVLLPNITGSIDTRISLMIINPSLGAFANSNAITSKQSNFGDFVNSSTCNITDLNFNASISNSYYGKHHIVQPLSLVLNYVIKY